MLFYMCLKRFPPTFCAYCSEGHRDPDPSRFKSDTAFRQIDWFKMWTYFL